MEALHCICMQAVLVRWCGHQCRRRAAIEASGAPHILTSFRGSERLCGSTLCAKLLARPLLASPAAPVSACQAGTQGETWADTGSQEPFLWPYMPQHHHQWVQNQAFTTPRPSATVRTQSPLTGRAATSRSTVAGLFYTSPARVVIYVLVLHMCTEWGVLLCIYTRNGTCEHGGVSEHQTHIGSCST